MEIPEGAAGTRATLALMRDLVIEYRKNPEIRNLAAQLVRDLDGKDYVGEVKAVHRFVRDNMRYLRDIADVETLHTPIELLMSKQGDCDDQATLVATLLQSIGHPVRFMVIGFAPGQYDHVYTESKIGDRWFSVETTEPVDVGWQPKGVQSRMIWNI